MSDTPRTDALWLTEANSEKAWYRVAEEMRDHSRDLERELSTAKWDRDEALKDLEFRRGLFELQTQTLAEVIVARDEVRKQRDILEKALLEIANCDFVITLPDRMDAVRAIARDALYAAEGGQP